LPQMVRINQKENKVKFFFPLIFIQTFTDFKQSQQILINNKSELSCILLMLYISIALFSD
jgi:hypothetical protein